MDLQQTGIASLSETGLDSPRASLYELVVYSKKIAADRKSCTLLSTHARLNQASNSHTKTIRYVVPVPMARTVIIETVRLFSRTHRPLSNCTAGVVHIPR